MSGNLLGAQGFARPERFHPPGLSAYVRAPLGAGDDQTTGLTDGGPDAIALYVGIGVGAGWATTYQGQPACLHGLEKCAELHWVDRDTLAALAAHELGHLAHEHWWLWQGLGGLATGTGPLWRLY